MITFLCQFNLKWFNLFCFPVCELQFKLGKLHVSECLKETKKVTNISEIEVRVEQFCDERLCLFGPMRVEDWRCYINSSRPEATYQGTFLKQSS